MSDEKWEAIGWVFWRRARVAVRRLNAAVMVFVAVETREDSWLNAVVVNQPG